MAFLWTAFVLGVLYGMPGAFVGWWVVGKVWPL